MLLDTGFKLDQSLLTVTPIDFSEGLQEVDQSDICAP